MIILKPAIFELMTVVRYDHIPIYNLPSRVRIQPRWIIFDVLYEAGFLMRKLHYSRSYLVLIVPRHLPVSVGHLTSACWHLHDWINCIKVIYTKVEQVSARYSCLHARCSLLRAAKATQWCRRMKNPCMTSLNECMWAKIIRVHSFCLGIDDFAIV